MACCRQLVLNATFVALCVGMFCLFDQSNATPLFKLSKDEGKDQCNRDNLQLNSNGTLVESSVCGSKGCGPGFYNDGTMTTCGNVKMSTVMTCFMEYENCMKALEEQHKAMQDGVKSGKHTQQQVDAKFKFIHHEGRKHMCHHCAHQFTECMHKEETEWFNNYEEYGEYEEQEDHDATHHDDAHQK